MTRILAFLLVLVLFINFAIVLTNQFTNVEGNKFLQSELIFNKFAEFSSFSFPATKRMINDALESVRKIDLMFGNLEDEYQAFLDSAVLFPEEGNPDFDVLQFLGQILEGILSIPLHILNVIRVLISMTCFVPVLIGFATDWTNLLGKIFDLLFWFLSPPGFGSVD